MSSLDLHFALEEFHKSLYADNSGKCATDGKDWSFCTLLFVTNKGVMNRSREMIKCLNKALDRTILEYFYDAMLI